MNTDSVKKSFIYNFILKVITFLIPLVTAPYLSRVLTPSGIGDYSFSHSIVTYFVLLIAFGLSDFGTLQISKCRLEKEEYSKKFWNVVFCRFFLFLFSTTLYTILIFCNVFGDSISKKVYIAYIVLLVGTALDITFLFQGLEKFRFVSLISITSKLISLVFIFVFVKSENDLIIYVIIQSAYTLFISIFEWLYAIKHIITKSFSFQFLGDTFKNAFLFFLPTVAVTLYTVVDRTMIGVISSKIELAYYDQAYKIIEIPCNAINAITPIMLARVVFLYKTGNETEVKRKITQMFNLMALLIFPSIAGLYAINGFFIPTYFGEEYVGSISVMYILIPLILLTTISNNVRNVYYAPKGKIKLLTIFLFVGSGINILLNTFLIKEYGACGAAIASIISEMIICLLIVIFSAKEINYLSMLKTFIRPFLASIIMFFALFFANNYFFDEYSNLIVSIIDISIGAMLYCTLCVILKDELVLSFIRLLIFKLKKKKE